MATVAAPRYRPIGKINHDHSAAWRHLDLVLLATVAAISGLGLLMVYSATRGIEQPYDTSYVTKQFMYVVLGVTAMAGVAMVDYRKIRDLASVHLRRRRSSCWCSCAHRSARARTAPRAGSRSDRSSCSRPRSRSSG